MNYAPFAIALLVACSSKPAPSAQSSSTPSNAAPRATGGHADVESAVKAFNTSLESGEPSTIRSQFPPAPALASHVDARCATAWDAMFDEWVTALTSNSDIKAMQGRPSTFVKLDAAPPKIVEAGTEGEGCKFTQPVQFVKTSTTWELEGETHQFELTVIQLDGRYYAFDLPGK